MRIIECTFDSVCRSIAEGLVEDDDQWDYYVQRTKYNGKRNVDDLVDYMTYHDAEYVGEQMEMFYAKDYIDDLGSLLDMIDGYKGEDGNIYAADDVTGRVVKRERIDGRTDYTTVYTTKNGIPAKKCEQFFIRYEDILVYKIIIDGRDLFNEFRSVLNVYLSRWGGWEDSWVDLDEKNKKLTFAFESSPFGTVYIDVMAYRDAFDTGWLSDYADTYYVDDIVEIIGEEFSEYAGKLPKPVDFDTAIESFERKYKIDLDDETVEELENYF